MVNTESEWKIIVALLGVIGSLLGMYFNNRNAVKRDALKTQWDKYDKLEARVNAIESEYKTSQGRLDMLYDEHLTRIQNGGACRPQRKRKK